MRKEGDKENIHRLYMGICELAISDCITESPYWFTAYSNEALLIMSLKLVLISFAEN